MKQRGNIFKKSLIAYGFICGVVGTLFALAIEMGLEKAMAIGIVLFCAVFLYSLVSQVIKSGLMNAFWEQRRVGCFKGLWRSENLSSELKRNFENAYKIKIKVTRGSELFDENQSGHINNYLESLRDSASREREIYCQILLIAPCYRLRHVKMRHELSRKEYPNPEQFLGSWYDTIRAVDGIEREKRNVHFHIDVRFYSGRHSKWRFYIFESIDRGIKTVLFSDYDANRRRHGTELPMYKVLENEQNIGGFMERYFDEIWDVALTRESFKDAVTNGKCVRKFCEECDIASVNNSECQLFECPGEKCKYEAQCIDYVNKNL